MQELLGRLRALDPEASQGLRVIACFDELMSGRVAIHGLLSAAAALASTPAGVVRAGKTTRVSTEGDALDGAAPEARLLAVVDSDAQVWIERDPERATPNDAIILERLALAVRMRLDPLAAGDARRALGTALDETVSEEERRAATAQLRLADTALYRVVAAPLFARWSRHPQGPEDVLKTNFGPVHVAVIDADAEILGSPIGLGVTTHPGELTLSFKTALIALRLCDTSDSGAKPFCADELGGLAEVLADMPANRSDRDARGMAEVMALPWGYVTIDTLVRSASMREAAREAGVHHSTMASRLATIERELGFDPLSGFGRTRLGIAFLGWRLRNSRVFDLPGSGQREP